MKNLFLFIVALFAGAWAQEFSIRDSLFTGPNFIIDQNFSQYTISPSIGYDQFGFGRVVTDSIVWRVTSVDNAGDSTCCHEWVESESHRAGGNSYCCVFHAGEHCDWDDLIKSRICRLCLRKETLREQWYQHRASPPETEYDKLNRELNEKGIVKQ